MSQLTVKILPPKTSTYPVWINANLLQRTNWLPKNLPVKCIVVVTDRTVKKWYANALTHSLKKSGYTVLLLSFPAGEKSKNDQTLQYLAKQMLQQQCGRDTLCIALGGGVVGDLTGYLAAIYMRGLPYIQIPTTLLAMVDSSVGGKTGINTAYGKNLIGAFWQPKAVIADVHCLQTLPKKHIINGLIEALKIFVTHDKKSFFYLQKNLDHLLAKDETHLKNIIQRAIKIKAAIVAQDEKEQNLRMTLNFGHTIGHALEQISQYKMLHGYAVAFGILVEAKISQMLGMLDNHDYLAIHAILLRLGFKGDKLKKFDVEKILQVTHLDKKATSGKTRYVLLKSIGQVYQTQKIFSHYVPNKVVKKAFSTVIGF